MVTVRLAEIGDVEGIRDLLADDELGRKREDMTEAGLLRYQKAFQDIQDDPGNSLYVAFSGDDLVGTFQVTWIPYLSRGGNRRALIEAVRVASDKRGQGIGRQMMLYAIEEARRRGCGIVQLTTDQTREAAHRFYLGLGFETTHYGMKLML